MRAASAARIDVAAAAVRPNRSLQPRHLVGRRLRVRAPLARPRLHARVPHWLWPRRDERDPRPADLNEPMPEVAALFRTPVCPASVAPAHRDRRALERGQSFRPPEASALAIGAGERAARPSVRSSAPVSLPDACLKGCAARPVPPWIVLAKRQDVPQPRVERRSHAGHGSTRLPDMLAAADGGPAQTIEPTSSTCARCSALARTLDDLSSGPACLALPSPARRLVVPRAGITPRRRGASHRVCGKCAGPGITVR